MGRGSYYRYNKKELVTDLLALDIAVIARRVDLARPGRQAWVWTIRRGLSERTASIHFDILPGQGLRLDYNYGGEPVPPYVAPVVTTEPNYGGRRYWFLCPHCRRRCRILYGGKYFLCRQCHQLTYETAQSGGDPIATIDNRLLFLHAKLQGKDNFLTGPPAKPRHMQWRTYSRLASEYMNLLHLRNRAFTAKTLALMNGQDHGLFVTPEAARQEFEEEWQAYKQQPDGGLSAWCLPAEDEGLAELATEPERLTLGELAASAGVPYAFAQEAVTYDLLRPDGGRGTRKKRYRSRLAKWLAKLQRLRQAGMEWGEIKAWSKRRWQAGHEHERRWPEPLAAAEP